MSDPTIPLPDRAPAEIHHRHRDVSGGRLRPTVFGAMDGLVSNVALIAGVAGASASSTQVSLAGFAGLVGGAISMAAGEYVSVQSQNESTQAEITIERRELARNAAAELDELTRSYVARGVDPDLARLVAGQLSRDPDQALLVHAQQELGIDPGALPSPWTAAVASLGAFGVGALVPLAPYLLGATQLAISAVVTVLALFAAGAASARFTSRTWMFAGVRQLLLGVLAAAVTFGVGAVFHATVT